MVQFLPMPAIAYPQNAMINFQPMNQALQFYANNQLERGRFGLQQNADLREQDMHPLRMDQTRAQTAGLWGQERRAETMLPLQMDQTRAQTGLTRAQTGLTGVQAVAARDANLRAQDLHVPALGMANNNLAASNLDRDQRIAALLAQATTPQQHQMIIGALQARRIPIPAGLDTWQGSQQGAANIAGPAYTAAQIQDANLRRLNPRLATRDLMDAAAAVGWDVNSPRGPTPGQAWGLTGQIPQAQPMSGQAQTNLFESSEAIEAGRQAIQSLDQALALSNTAFSGIGAAGRGRAVDQWSPGGRGTDTVQLQNLIQRQVVTQLRAIFGANPSNRENEILQALEGDINVSVDARNRMITAARQAAANRINYHIARAHALRTGEFFQPNYNDSVNYATLAARAQQGQGGGQPQGQGQPNGAPGAIPQINSAADRAQLPVGSRFNWGGRVYIKVGPDQYRPD